MTPSPSRLQRSTWLKLGLIVVVVAIALGIAAFVFDDNQASDKCTAEISDSFPRPGVSYDCS